MTFAIRRKRDSIMGAAHFLLIPTIGFHLLFVTVACERAGEVPPEGANTSAGGNGAEVAGFVVGQVATGSGPRTGQPITVMSDADLGRRVRHAILDLQEFHEEPWDGPTVDFRLTWTIGRGTAEPPPAEQPGHGESVGYAVLYLELTGEADRDHRFEFEVQGIYRETIAADETTERAGERLIVAGVVDMIAGLEHEVAPICSSDEDLVEMLSAEPIDVDQLLPAIRQVHRRRLQEAAPALRSLLETEDLELLLAVVSTLGRLHDAEAVEPLIELVSRRHRELTQQVLPILGEIGSLESRRYLEAVATGHESAAVRALAREVMEDYFGSGRP